MTKYWKGIAIGTLIMFAAGGSVSTAAASDAEAETALMQAAQSGEQADASEPQRTAADARAEAKAARDAEKAQAQAAKKAARAAKKAEEKREKKARYKTLFVDNGFTYYLDSKNSRWVLRPNSGRERMIEAWVRLVENTTGDTVAEDGKVRPNKYFLEHYYISPERREIMFISELEVTGRPENAVKERPSDAANWEQLVPGSIEDDLFDAIIAKMKQAPGERSGVLSGTSGMSLRDMIEEFARISL